MEYAANAAEYWGSGRVRNETTKYWNKRRNDVNEVISAELGRDDVEDFWREVEEKLQRGQIRLIVAADELRPEVRRIIEYLNKEMKNAKIYGLELRHYKDESSTIIVPRLVGQTQAIADQKETSKPVKLWTADELRDAYDTLPDPNLGQRLRKVLDWAVNQGFFVQGRTQSPGFGLRGRSGSRIVSFFPEYVFCYLKDARYTGGAQERDRLVAELKTIGMYDPSFDPRFNETKNLARKLTDLSEGEFNTLLDIFTRFCAKAEGAA